MSVDQRTRPELRLSFLNDPWRVGGVLGIAFLVMFAIGAIISGAVPEYDDDIADIRAFFEEDGDRFLLGDWFIAVALVVIFLPFAATVRTVLGKADSSGIWARTAFIGAIAFVALGGGTRLAWGTLALTGTEGLDDSTVRALMYADAYAFAAVPFGSGLFIAATSVVILQTAVFWRWLGIVGLVIALLGILGGLWVVDGDRESVLGVLGILSFPLTGLWILAISVLMLLRKSPYANEP